MEYFELLNGVKIPALGYGTYKTPPGDICADGVRVAIETGYRLIDTAAFYANEHSVKQGIVDSGVCPNDIFVTSKLWNTDQGYDNTLRAFDKTLSNLGADCLDLYLIHWPIAFDFRERWQSTINDTWRAFERLYNEKLVRAIGVSNFQVRHLKFLLTKCNIAPMVNQIEIHVGYPEAEVVDFCRELGIIVEAWAPLAKGRAFDLPQVKSVAASSGRTPAQVLIRWCMDKGIIPLPKSVTPSRIAENFNVFSFSLSESEMKLLDSITEIGRLGSHPDDITF